MQQALVWSNISMKTLTRGYQRLSFAGIGKSANDAETGLMYKQIVYIYGFINIGLY